MVSHVFVFLSRMRAQTLNSGDEILLSQNGGQVFREGERVRECVCAGEKEKREMKKRLTMRGGKHAYPDCLFSIHFRFPSFDCTVPLGCSIHE